MRFYLTFEPEGVLTLPLAHHHILQGFIYSVISSNKNYSQFLHEQGYRTSGSSFKLFTFGPLNGTYHVNRQRKEIRFFGAVTFEVRSADFRFSEAFLDGLYSNTLFHLGGTNIHITDINTDSYKITSNRIQVRMLSPIVLYHTISTPKGNKTIYHNPLEDHYETWLNDNLQRKYYSLYHNNSVPYIKFSTICVSSRDKYVTLFKNHTYINGWKGTYQLQAPSDILDFLYYAGLGSKNSEGFGMFEVK